MSTYRGLPPLTTLIGFEAAARLGSFSRAAEELNITQSAISHQVRVLEDHLGQPLFRRIGRRIELVDAGADFLITAQTALEELRHGVRRLNAYSKPGSVIILMPAALATGWFLPRLADLRASHPWVDPWVHSADTPHVPRKPRLTSCLAPNLGRMRAHSRCCWRGMFCCHCAPPVWPRNCPPCRTVHGWTPHRCCMTRR